MDENFTYEQLTVSLVAVHALAFTKILDWSLASCSIPILQTSSLRPSHQANSTYKFVLVSVCAVVCLLATLVSEGRDIGLWIAGVGDSKGPGGPVSIILQLQGQVPVSHLWGLVSEAE